MIVKKNIGNSVKKFVGNTIKKLGPHFEYPKLIPQGSKYTK